MSSWFDWSTASTVDDDPDPVTTARTLLFDDDQSFDSRSCSSLPLNPSTIIKVADSSSDRVDEQMKEDHGAGEGGGVEDLTDMMSNMFTIQTQNSNGSNYYDVRASFAEGHETTPTDDYSAKFASSAPAQSFTKSVDRIWAEEFNTTTDSNMYTIDETPELISTALQKMDDEINSETIPLQEKQAHVRAVELHNKHCYQHGFPPSNEYCYVCTQYFRLRFLRADRYNPQKAAIRYCKSLNVLRTFFGDVSLTRQLYLSDLTDDEIKFLMDGMVQLLPSRDPVGRRILFVFSGIHYSHLKMLRRTFFIFSIQRGSRRRCGTKKWNCLHLF